jgi:hypothetical protein
MGKADEEPKFYLQEVSCSAAETDREYTVAEWIAHEGLALCRRQVLVDGRVQVSDQGRFRVIADR